ncbi:MAG: Gp15 family bacteriophage protein [Clostridia bacterium]
MLRPNLAMDAPPDFLRVGGASYPIDVDFRTWLLIAEKSNDLYIQINSPDDLLHNLSAICDMEARAFGGVLESEDPYEALAAMTAFLRGYPEPPKGAAPEARDAVYSFNYDLNYIILAIRNQSGIDLSFARKEPFHWWRFLLEFRSLCGNHYILRMMDIRGYEADTGKDAHREALALKHLFALPYEMNADERRAAQEFDQMMEGEKNED